jgi:hypothetical protein
MNWNRLLSDPGVLAMLIPILGILYFIVAAAFKHRERMAMIGRGMNPDSIKEKDPD